MQYSGTKEQQLTSERCTDAVMIQSFIETGDSFITMDMLTVRRYINCLLSECACYRLQFTFYQRSCIGRDIIITSCADMTANID